MPPPAPAPDPSSAPPPTRTEPAPDPVPDATATAVIVAAGRGERVGAPDKVFLPLAGRPVLAHVLDTVERAASIRDVVVVVGAHTLDKANDVLRSGPWTKIRAVVVGGTRRQDSVTAGVAAVPAGAEVVVVHDAARPLAPPALFDRCVAAAIRAGAAIAAVPIADTVKRVAGGRVAGTVPRDGLWAAQTPQAFRRDVLLEAMSRADSGTAVFTDEAQLCEALGIPVEVVPGPPTNLKITHPGDIAVAEALLRLAAGAAPPEVSGQ